MLSGGLLLMLANNMVILLFVYIGNICGIDSRSSAAAAAAS
jgi:hypothetical protein